MNCDNDNSGKNELKHFKCCEIDPIVSIRGIEIGVLPVSPSYQLRPAGRSTSGDEYMPNVASRSTNVVTDQSSNSTQKNSFAAAEQRKKRRKSGDVVRAFACQLCTKRYGTRAALSLHFKLKHELPLRKRCFLLFVVFILLWVL